MKKLLIALVALIPFVATAVESKMTHKWDEEQYANGNFRVKKHDYPKAKGEPAPEVVPDAEEKVKIDHKGRIYRHSEFPSPRHPQTSGTVQHGTE